MTSYKDIGLTRPDKMLHAAYHGGYAIGAYNFVFMEQLLAITDAAVEEQSPLILQASAHTCHDLGMAFIRHLAAAAAEKTVGQIPLALNLDHGLSYDDCKDCIDNGFSSVMIDGSGLDFEGNIKLTKKVVEYAHERGVSVEAELGRLGGKEGDVYQAEGLYTNPDAAKEFADRTDVDCLAVSVGSSHGLVKIRPNPDGSLPSLRFDILERIKALLPGYPLVLHGSSCLYQKYIDMANANGGHVTGAQGIPEEQVMKAARETAICKINIASDGWSAATAAVRRALTANPGSIDPRVFLKPAREEMKELYKHKISAVMGSSGKACLAGSEGL